MIDRQMLAHELETARLARLQAQAAGQWLEDLIEQMRQGRFWRPLAFAQEVADAPVAAAIPGAQAYPQPLAA